ncbi:hypothetical protein HC766_05455 [Candidatus Gracilibacteria bacterium]|nr:hypothetical protein [Candidatus Gracilibacteria bacterium]
MDFNNINFSELNQRIKLIKIKENNQQKLSAIQKKYDVKMTSTGPKPEHIKAGKYFSHVLGKLCGCDKTINQFEINTKSQFFVNCLKKNKDNLIVAFENEFNKTKSLRFECFDEVENNLFLRLLLILV